MSEHEDPASGGRVERPAGVREVAARAGVSVGTVSNVLNRPDRVGEATRQRVERAMSDLGFVPSQAAGQLRGRRSKLVGVLVPDVGNPYWASILRGIEGVLDAAGLSMIVASTRQDRKRQRHLLRVFQSQGVDGLIIAPIAQQRIGWPGLERSQLGIVEFERPASGAGAWVSLDHAAGAEMAMGHLLDLGHRRIAFINGPHFVPWCAARWRGCVSAVERRGLDLSSTVREVAVQDLVADAGERAALPLLESGEVTAIFCANDMLALGAFRAIRMRGMKVPDDVSLVGFDDADFAAVLDPPLTTVRQPSYAMGVAAAELLLRGERRLAGENVEFPPSLVVRASTGAVGG